MQKKIRRHRDFLLFGWLVLSLVAYPLLDTSMGLRWVRGGVMLVLLTLATASVSEKRHLLRPCLFLLFGAVCFAIANVLGARPVFLAAQWAIITALFAVIVGGLFSYVRHARKITNAHLYTAASIYLLQGMMWFGLYNAIEVIFPGSFLQAGGPLSARRVELLYFSMVTLTTVGYGDVLPVVGAVRMLAALEAATGVLYVAITVALLVSKHKESDQETR